MDTAPVRRNPPRMARNPAYGERPVLADVSNTGGRGGFTKVSRGDLSSPAGAVKSKQHTKATPSPRRGRANAVITQLSPAPPRSNGTSGSELRRGTGACCSPPAVKTVVVDSSSTLQPRQPASPSPSPSPSGAWTAPTPAIRERRGDRATDGQSLSLSGTLSLERRTRRGALRWSTPDPNWEMRSSRLVLAHTQGARVMQ
jgi:hypothetical protein